MAEDTYKRVGEIERCFGVVTIDGKRCGVDGCDELPVAVYPIRTSEEVGVWWFCAEHAAAVMAEVSDLVPVDITMTCGLGSDVPCGAAATHVAITGVRTDEDERNLACISVCEKHAERLNT